MSTEKVLLPDLGDTESVEVIELNVAVGEHVALEQSVVVVESEKASMDVESTVAGKVVTIHVKEGDQLTGGAVLLDIEADASTQKADTDSSAVSQSQPERPTPSPPERTVKAAAVAPAAPAATPAVTAPATGVVAEVYAGPAVRRLAREFGIDLRKVRGTGKKGRLLKEDLQQYVRELISKGSQGAALPSLPEVDFERYGTVRQERLSKLEQAVGKNMHRNWVNLPHVTQFDNADLTDLEDTRAKLKSDATKRKLKLTPVTFLIRACAMTLKNHSKLNASLLNDGQHVVYKEYVHIGMAVDTPAGLVVPVIRDADKKNLWELAEEVVVLAEKARTRKLKQQDMQGGTFTISSLGGIGGAGFTPIINAPEVAILGVSKMDIRPVWNGKQFAPHKILPISLSYDHRVINGGDAGRFMTDLVALLADPDTITGARIGDSDKKTKNKQKR